MKYQGREHVSVECIVCGKESLVRKSEVDRGWGKFCSRGCATKHRYIVNPGTAKGTCNGRARKVYMKKFGTPSCSHCGSVPADVHHLNEDVTDNRIENLIALCRSCHVAYHNHVSPKRKRATG